VFYEVRGSSRGKAIHNHHQYGQEYLEYLKRMHGFVEFRSKLFWPNGSSENFHIIFLYNLNMKNGFQYCNPTLSPGAMNLKT
jgi:hypothetical protein